MVDGWKEIILERDMYMQAGEVKAKVWYSKKEKMELKQTSVNRTGAEQKKYCIIDTKTPKTRKINSKNN